MKFRSSLLAGLVMVCCMVTAQAQLKPGFDPQEYLEMLDLVRRQSDLPKPVSGSGTAYFTHDYQSPEVGLFNRWDLWVRADKKLAVINIRGTVGETESWLENYNAAQILAIGSLQLDKNTRFDYKLAADSSAHVHAGWTLGLAYLAPTIVEKVKACYSQGIKEYIIMGHSQGGAIAFLLTSYLHYNNDIPKDIVVKSYCSAAPKPGNQEYAYDFDFITRGGWAMRVVNARDWVPESPFSTQTTSDFNEVNPYRGMKKSLKGQSFMVRKGANYLYNRMDRPTKRSARRFTNILGGFVFKRIQKKLPDLQKPHYISSHSYMTAGVPVVLMPDAAYNKLFPFDGKNVFVHHLLDPYAYLVNSIYLSGN